MADHLCIPVSKGKGIPACYALLGYFCVATEELK